MWISPEAAGSLVHMRTLTWGGPGLVTKESALRHAQRGGPRMSKLEYQRVENLDEVWLNWQPTV